MLIVGSRLLHQPVMGLQTGSELARTTQPIIDPATLGIVAYRIASPLRPGELYVRIDDIRELSNMGFIVDALDEFVQPNDVIKLDKVIALEFPLVGMTARDQKNRKLGRVIDYTVDLDSFIIQQLTLRRPLVKSLNDAELVVHRSQIVEINRDAIIIDSEAEVPEHTRLTAPGSYVNPFRKPSTAADSADIGNR